MFKIMKLLLKVLSFLIISCVLFALTLRTCCYLAFGNIDFTLIIQHASLIKSYPILPFYKEIILGIILFSCLMYICCKYWKISVFLCCGIILFFLWEELSFKRQKDMSLFKREYMTLHPKANNQKTKNIIVISLESFEDAWTFDDITNAGNLMPKLTSLKKEGISFDGYHQVNAMMPTIPSFYSKNCGIAPRPTALFSLVTESKYHSYGPFSNALCVSDILKENNYHVYYVMGGELTDEGAKDFFDAHPIDAAVGKYELLRLGYSQMGTAYFIPDLSLYEYSKRILSEVKDEPFALYIVTANTHGPKNDLYRVEPECEKKYNDPRDVFLCLDKISFDFVKWCQAQPWYENTVIYLIGDHLTLPTSIFMNKQNIKNHPHRQIYTLMLDGVHSNKVIKKEFTQLDFAPTFLESIGFVSPKFGLGYSLFRDTPTLVEKLGEKTFVEELQKSTDDFHKIVNGITSNKEE